MRLDIVQKIAAAFGVQPWQIAPELEGSKVSSAAFVAEARREVSGELTHWGEVSGGIHELVREGETPKREKLPRTISAVTIRGDSMSPIVLSGQTVLFDTEASVTNGDLALLRLKEGDILCKRYFEDKKRGVAVLVSQRQNEEPKVISLTEIAEVYKVAGVLF